MRSTSRRRSLLVAISATIVSAGAAAAQDPAQIVLRDDLYVAGSSVTVTRDVPGDLVAAGGTVVVTGRVAQDALVAGGMVEIAGDVGDVLRVAGGNVSVGGVVGGYVVAGGGIVHLLPSARVAGGVFVNAGQVTLDGSVRGPIEIRGGEARINGTVEDTVEVQAGTVALGEHAVLKKGLTYTSKREASIASGAQVLGTTRRVPEGPHGALAGRLAVLPVPAIAKFLGLVLTGIAIVLVFPAFARSVTKESLAHFGRDLVVGGSVLVLAPAAAILLVVSLVGLPLGVLGGLAYVTMLFLATICAGLLVGTVVWRLVMKEKEARVDWKTAVVGLALLPAVAWVPVLGWLAWAALVVAALGSVCLVSYRAVRPGHGPHAPGVGGAKA